MISNTRIQEANRDFTDTQNIKDWYDTIVALPQRGIELGEKITRDSAEIEVLPVEEITHPETSEIIGSIAADGTLWMNKSLDNLGLEKELFEKLRKRHEKEARKAYLVLMSGRDRNVYRKRRVILSVGSDVSQSNIMAALGSIRKNGPAEIRVLTDNEDLIDSSVNSVADKVSILQINSEN